MADSGERRTEPSVAEHPPWSVMAGECDPDTLVINGQVVGLMVDATWSYLPLNAEMRTAEYAGALVQKAFDLCGLDGRSLRLKVSSLSPTLGSFKTQGALAEATPALNPDADEEKKYRGPSPVMNSLRLLIDRCNEDIEKIYIDDRQVSSKSRWQVDGDTRRRAEAIVRALYLAEYGPAEDV